MCPGLRSPVSAIRPIRYVMRPVVWIALFVPASQQKKGLGPP